MLRRATTDPARSCRVPCCSAATIVVMQAVSVLYLPDRFERASALYGAIGTTIVTLGWFFVLGRVIPLALALDAVIHERFGSVARFDVLLADPAPAGPSLQADPSGVRSRGTTERGE